MDLDSYLTPQAQSLLRSGRARRHGRLNARRGLVIDAGAAAIFLAAASVIATQSTWGRPLSVPALGVSCVAYMIARRVRFAVGSAWTMPTQLVFVPMLFMLPTPLVPLIVAGCSVLDLWPDALGRRMSATRLVGRIADCSYSLGAVLVLVLTGQQKFAWTHWPVLLLAFAAQILFDGASGLGRTWLIDRIGPRGQPQMVWLYLTDACFSSAGLLIAGATIGRPALILLTLPLFGLLSQFANERRGRLRSTLELSSAYRGAAELLGDVIDAVDHYTGVHTRQVVELSIAVTKAMDLDPVRERDVEFAAMLHDVGKIRVPVEIINKPGKLDAAEWECMRQHTIEGEAMLKKVGGTLAGVGPLVRSSHERYDGGGYPDRLAGEDIPIESRIVCACDAYNAMTTNRPYRPARPRTDALTELRRCSGSQFDPDVVQALQAILA